MNRWFPILLVAVVVAGCQSQQKPATQTSSVLDVSSPQRPNQAQPSGYYPSTYTPPAATPPPAEPIPAAVVETTAPSAAVPASATAPASGSKYTVKKGDTLYHIAREKYGDGKQWQRIAAANPGVSPTTLKVGQTLVMP